MKNSKFKIPTALVLLFSIFLFSISVRSQVRPVYDYGANGLGQLLKKLSTTKSVMMIGAHPDDEDSALLAYLARGENARTAYLSLTRGDGGQNIIGSELFESLGVIRTEELLQARRLDGAEQFFTRAFDYGFSKTLTEAKQKWNEKIILCDTVRAIRMFRPLVVISRFSGTPADGHGHHQFAGYISPLAVAAAADSAQCTDSGAAWQVQKFYVEQGFRDNSQPALRINTGEYDSLLGRSYFEIAMEGRSQHKTQEQGVLELKGEQFSGLNLVKSKAAKVEKETNIFDGIDTSLKTVSPQASDAAIRAMHEFDLSNSQKIISILIEGLQAIRKAGDSQKEIEFSEAIRLANGIQIDALADRETIAPGESFQTTVRVFFPNSQNIKVKEIKLTTPSNWQASKMESPKDANQNAFRRETAKETNYFKVKVPSDAKLTAPYWLETVRKTDLFDWQKDENQNLPFQPPIVSAVVKIEINGAEIILNQLVEYRFADAIRGEVRRELNVVPRVSLNLDQKLLIVPQDKRAQVRKINLSLTNNSAAATSGAAKLNVPKNWQIAPAEANFDLKNKGEKKSIEFAVTIPANVKTSNVEIGAQATVNGEVFARTMNEISYPHIQTHRFYTAAETKVNVLDLKIATVKTGYIMGSGDEVPEAVRQMNLPVDFLGEKDLSSGDLSKYDVIVAGIRAFQVRQDLIANNQRILDYVKNGGTLIVQYQRPDYVANNLQPFPASMTDTQKTTAGTTARVTDENAKVTILQPESPIFNFPNKISDADFAGWVQERNLYDFVTFDAKYTALLESHDAGEQENKGGMVYAKIGRGNYVYTSYSFFRQLPAGVSGAYRLFANLLSLPKAGQSKD